MDRDHAPRALDAELLEEGRRDDGLVAGKAVRIDQGAAHDAHDDDGQATAEDLRAVSDDRSPEDRAHIGHDLGNRHFIGAKAVLVRKHRGVQILRAVGL